MGDAARCGRAVWQWVAAGGAAGLLSFACLGSLVVGPAVWAQELKIGYVDVARVFDGYQRTKDLDASLGRKAQQKESELEGRVNELKKLREGLELLNEQTRDGRVREIEAKADELKRFRTNTARDLRGERDDMARTILQEVHKAIEAHAKANGFAYLFDARSVLYGQPGVDVTDAVLQQLNGGYKGGR